METERLDAFADGVFPFVRFPTNLIAEHLHAGGFRAAALIYGANLTITACFFNLFWVYATSGRRLVPRDADQKLIAGISRSSIPGPPLYGGATLVAPVSPTASVARFAGVALSYLIEGSIFGGAPVRN